MKDFRSLKRYLQSNKIYWCVIEKGMPADLCANSLTPYTIYFAPDNQDWQKMCAFFRVCNLVSINNLHNHIKSNKCMFFGLVRIYYCIHFFILYFSFPHVIGHVTHRKCVIALINISHQNQMQRTIIYGMVKELAPNTWSLQHV